MLRCDKYVLSEGYLLMKYKCFNMNILNNNKVGDLCLVIIDSISSRQVFCYAYLIKGIKVLSQPVNDSKFVAGKNINET